jgi:hypothetical protein
MAHAGITSPVQNGLIISVSLSICKLLRGSIADAISTQQHDVLLRSLRCRPEITVTSGRRCSGFPAEAKIRTSVRNQAHVSTTGISKPRHCR